MPKLDEAKLDRIYEEANQVDDKLFAEMRSNILLVSGDHYTKKGSQFWNRVRTSKELDEETKLKLTKNHIENICGKLEANIMSFAPAALVVPNNQDEIQDQKTAELNNSVLEFYKKKWRFRSRMRDFCSSLVQLGECHAKIYWNERKGALIGYEPLLGEDGEPELDENGEMQTDKGRPVFEGEFELEEVLAFNLLRDPNCQNLEDSPYYIVRKMVPRKQVKDMLKENDKIKEMEKIDNNEETYLVFDGDKAEYSKDDKGKHIMLREHYYRPCPEYPNGYFYITVRDVIISEGELPFGIWPFVSAGYNKIKTSARFRSPIKTMRPYQIEINRTASEIATTQITLGQDKLIMWNGSKITHGGRLAGVRGINVSGGKEPMIMPGRSGGQFFEHMKDQIAELYQVMNVEEGDPIKNGQLDPYAMLYVANKNRQKFSKQGETFEEFVIEIAEKFLELARHYLDEEMVVPMIGKSERVNIMEFKHSEPWRYRIKIEPISDDANSMLGKQLSIQHMLQYVGKDLDANQIGMMIKNMPYLNDEEMGTELTLDYDNYKNDFLAIERGEEPLFNQYDNHAYLINKAANRMRKPDFRFLDPSVQAMYQAYIEKHQEMEAANQEAKQRMLAGWIPTDGPMITVDYYITVTGEDGEKKTKRAKLPQSSLQWLEQQLAAQGKPIEDLMGLNEGALAEMSQMMPEAGMPPQVGGGQMPPIGM